MFENLNPTGRATAFLEIIIMLLVAFILGFILAWILKRSKTVVDNKNAENDESRFNALKLESERIERERILLDSSNKKLQKDLDICKQSLQAPVETAGIDESEFNHLQKENERIEKERSLLSDNNVKLQEELTACKESLKTPEIKVVRNEPQVSEERSASDEENAKKLGFKTVTADRKDDLTKIKGVGPFIEKKLNGLGIYTFEQISEFTPDTVEKVTEAIEFFPGRIQRDNWVNQANDLK